MVNFKEKFFLPSLPLLVWEDRAIIRSCCCQCHSSPDSDSPEFSEIWIDPPPHPAPFSDKWFHKFLLEIQSSTLSALYHVGRSRRIQGILGYVRRTPQRSMGTSHRSNVRFVLNFRADRSLDRKRKWLPYIVNANPASSNVKTLFALGMAANKRENREP